MQQTILENLQLPRCACGVWLNGQQNRTSALECINPHDNTCFGSVTEASPTDAQHAVTCAQQAFLRWRKLPVPQRAAIVGKIGQAIAQRSTALSRLVALETGKPLVEAEGELQEVIDMAQFAHGLGRRLAGQIFPSERSGHILQEVWQPLGCVGIITAFNFPVAVWSWNAFLALVCGNTVIWKPSPKTPMCAVAIQQIVDDVLTHTGWRDVACLLCGGKNVGQRLVDDKNVALISATGSSAMGRDVAMRVAGRYGKVLLELGGNNAAIVMPDADLEQALRAVLFAAVGTCGQRCTTMRRLILHKDIAQAFERQLIKAYKSLRVGNPLDASMHVGPLIDSQAVIAMQEGLMNARDQGGQVLYGGEMLKAEDNAAGNYVRPAIVRANAQMGVLKSEIFAPILYTLPAASLEEAIALNNEVPQGLSSALFSNNIKDIHVFLSAAGSDCGLANVNTGTSGAEIGAAFGGEKTTGGGREAGSDAWKSYMRRQTHVINASGALPLAQGVVFSLR